MYVLLIATCLTKFALFNQYPKWFEKSLNPNELALLNGSLYNYMVEENWYHPLISSMPSAISIIPRRQCFPGF